MERRALRPQGWADPKGYENGIVVHNSSSLVFVAGQIAWNERQELVGAGDVTAQFRQALANVLAVVRTAGGEPGHLVSLTVYVTDKRAYLAQTRQIGAAWRELAGREFPAMALVQVADLLEEGALVEIQGIAALP